MFVGNLFALRQRNVRRMLAYSSVAHSGYILAAFAALQGTAVATAVEAVLIYSAAYAVMNLGAFLVIDLVGEETKSFNGLIRTSPGVATEHAGLYGLARRHSAALRFLREALDHHRGRPVRVDSRLRGGRRARREQRPLRPVLLRHQSATCFSRNPPARRPSPEGTGAVRFSVYVLAVATTLFGLLIIPLSALVSRLRAV